jgi:hypothetical protein
VGQTLNNFFKAGFEEGMQCKKMGLNKEKRLCTWLITTLRIAGVGKNHIDNVPLSACEIVLHSCKIVLSAKQEALSSCKIVLSTMQEALVCIARALACNAKAIV